MNLIIGGAFQGKTDYTMKKYSLEENEILDGGIVGLNEIIDAKCVRNFHLFIRGMVERGENSFEAAEAIAAQNPDIIIITDEIGSGIVPFEKIDREWREQTGRICCRLAQKAKSVTRIVSSIVIVIKDEE